MPSIGATTASLDTGNKPSGNRAGSRTPTGCATCCCAGRRPIISAHVVSILSRHCGVQHQPRFTFGRNERRGSGCFLCDYNDGLQSALYHAYPTSDPSGWAASNHCHDPPRLQIRSNANLPKLNYLPVVRFSIRTGRSVYSNLCECESSVVARILAELV